jgi:hypothetical protein
MDRFKCQPWRTSSKPANRAARDDGRSPYAPSFAVFTMPWPVLQAIPERARSGDVEDRSAIEQTCSRLGDIRRVQAFRGKAHSNLAGQLVGLYVPVASLQDVNDGAIGSSFGAGMVGAAGACSSSPRSFSDLVAGLPCRLFTSSSTAKVG